MRALAAALALLTLAACGGNQQPAVDAAKVLRDSASAMAQLRTVTATMKMTKGTISIQGFALATAKTSVRLPSESDTVYTVKEQDVSFQIEVVITGGLAYLHVPFSPFQLLSAQQAAQLPDMARLFDPATGLPAIIPAGSGSTYVSTDQVDGTSAFQVSTTYSPQQVHSLLSALSSSGPVAARVWVGASDHLVRKAVLDGAFGDAGKEAALEVDIGGFNSAVTIASPARTS